MKGEYSGRRLRQYGSTLVLWLSLSVAAFGRNLPHRDPNDDGVATVRHLFLPTDHINETTWSLVRVRQFFVHIKQLTGEMIPRWTPVGKCGS